MKIFKKLGVAAAVATLSFAASAGITIDDFSVGQGVTGGTVLLEDNTANLSGLWNSAAGASSSIIGGERDLFIQKLGGPPIPAVNTYVDGGTLWYSTDSGAWGRSYLKWDGVNGSSAVSTGSEANFMATLNPLGLGGLDLAATGSAFLIDVYNADLGFDFALTVYTSATQWTTLVLASVAHTNGSPPSSPISFADFAGATDTTGSLLPSGALRFTGAGGAADMSNVGALVAEVNFSGAETKIDFEILGVTTVPEPGSLALAGLALLGLGLSRRRKAA